MDENTTISWILLSTALASEQKPANFESIAQIADGINHYIPTHNELQESLRWLIVNEMVEKKGKRYQLTIIGAEFIEKAKSQTNSVLLNILDELTKMIKKRKPNTSYK
jgi:predicted transcriptional regulator